MTRDFERNEAATSLNLRRNEAFASHDSARDGTLGSRTFNVGISYFHSIDFCFHGFELFYDIYE